MKVGLRVIHVNVSKQREMWNESCFYASYRFRKLVAYGIASIQ